MYGKLFTSMYDGTLVENWKALVTFQQMIVLCESSGVIDMTPRAISYRTGIPISIIEEGIKVLEKEDPYSRTKEMNGIRIERLDSHRPWGWMIVNHAKYKKLVSYEEKKERDRLRMEAKRKGEKPNKNKIVANSRKESLSVESVADVAHADTDTDVLKTLLLSFKEIWKKYPNKDGSKKAFSYFKSSVKTEKDLKDINLALSNYIAHLSLKSNLWKKPKGGATWFNNWRDWADWVEPTQNGSGDKEGAKRYYQGFHEIHKSGEWIRDRSAITA